MSTTTTQRVTTTQNSTPGPDHPAVAAVARAMRHLASWRVWLASASVFTLFAGVFFGSSAPFAIPTVEAACGQAPPDVRFTSSPAEVGGFLEACGVAGREAYRAMQLADLVYPLVFAVFIASSLALVISHLAPRRPAFLALAALPLVASAFDYVENACAWLALASYPESCCQLLRARPGVRCQDRHVLGRRPPAAGRARRPGRGHPPAAGPGPHPTTRPR